MQVLSGRPDTVTGGDTLVRISGVTERVNVTIDEENVTHVFRPAGGRHTLVGRLTGLDLGTSRLTVRSGPRVVATAVLTNHPGPATGFGRRVIPDNVGVQYGLGALNDGTITVEQFIDLNAGVGGFDVDGNRTAARSEASTAALRRAYATGRVNEFTGGPRWTPVIEMRGYHRPVRRLPRPVPLLDDARADRRRHRQRRDPGELDRATGSGLRPRYRCAASPAWTPGSPASRSWRPASRGGGPGSGRPGWRAPGCGSEREAHRLAGDAENV